MTTLDEILTGILQDHLQYHEQTWKDLRHDLWNWAERYGEIVREACAAHLHFVFDTAQNADRLRKIPLPPIDEVRP